MTFTNVYRSSLHFFFFQSRSEFHRAYKPAWLEGVSTLFSPIYISLYVSRSSVSVMVFDTILIWFCRDKRAMPLIIDPGLYLSTKKDVFWVSPKRTLPTSFKLFTGKFCYSLYPNVYFTCLSCFTIFLVCSEEIAGY